MITWVQAAAKIKERRIWSHKLKKRESVSEWTSWFQKIYLFCLVLGVHNFIYIHNLSWSFHLLTLYAWYLHFSLSLSHSLSLSLSLSHFFWVADWSILFHLKEYSKAAISFLEDSSLFPLCFSGRMDSLHIGCRCHSSVFPHVENLFKSQRQYKHRQSK